MNDNTALLRQLPAVDEVMHSPWASDLESRSGRAQSIAWVREAVDACRKQILGGNISDAESVSKWIESHVLVLAELDDGRSIKHVINATGILLHTNLGRAPLPLKAVERMQQAAAYSNVETNLVTGRRSGRGERVTQLLAQLAGAEDAIVVNNCAAATMLVLQAVAGGKEVVISRGQLVEIGGGFRLPDVFQSSGVILKEVGTTNRTYVRDYESAVSDATGAVIRVHRSNFAQTGFVTEPSIEEMVAMDRPNDIPVIDDIGSGCIHDLSSFGLHEPIVGESVRAGAELTLFSGDKLFGGPQCGIVVGRTRWIDRLRKNPMMRAMRCDKLTLAGVEATTEIHLSGAAFDQIPILGMISMPAEVVYRRCLDIVQSLDALATVVEVVSCESPIGGGTLPGAALPSFALKITAKDVDCLARRLRLGTPAVQSRLSDDCLWLDLRSVAETEFEALIERLRDAFSESSDRGEQEACTVE